MQKYYLKKKKFEVIMSQEILAVSFHTNIEFEAGSGFARFHEPHCRTLDPDKWSPNPSPHPTSVSSTVL